MSHTSDVLLWAQRVVAKKTATPQQILEIAPDAGLDVAQEAFHKIARLAHPDLHRTTLSPTELELVTTAYARCAGAYQDVRSRKIVRGRAPNPPPPPDPSVPATVLIPSSPSPNKASAVPDPGTNPAQAMTSKALVHYRKAELCLRRGDLKGAMLQLKMAIASDPQSPLLRSALSEVEAEVGKKP